MITSTYGKVKLGDVVTLMHQGINTAADKVEYANSGVPIIQSKHFTSGTLSLDDSKYLSEKDVIKYGEKYTPKLGDILFSNIGTVGKSVVLERTPDFMFAWNVFLIRLNSEKAHNRYIKHFFDYLLSLNVYERWFTGGTVKFLNKKTMAEIEIPLPPLDEQKRIAAILDKADAIRRKRQQAIQLADDFLRSVFLDIFGDPVTNPKGWEVKSLKDISKIQIGPFGTQLHKEDYIEGGIPLINPTHIVKGNIVPKTNLSVSDEKHTSLPEYHLKVGDIIMGRRGEMGRCAIVSEKETGWMCGTGSLYIRPNKTGVFSEYLNKLLSSQAIKNHLESESQGATMPNLNKNIVGNIQIPFPSDKALKDFTQLKVKFLKLVETSQNFANEMIFESLSQKAFAGEL